MEGSKLLEVTYLETRTQSRTMIKGMPRETIETGYLTSLCSNLRGFLEVIAPPP